MKSAIAIAAIAGLASVAAADSLSIDISFADASIMVGETTTVTVMANFTVDSGTGYLSIVNFNAVGDDSLATASNLVGGTWGNDGTGFGGAVAGSGVNGIKSGASMFLGPVDESNPQFIASWTVTADAVGSFTYSATTDVAIPFGINDSADGNFGLPTTYGLEVVNSGTLNIVVPSPSAMALLGLGGLVAGRRRR